MTATELPRYVICEDAVGRTIVGFGERDGFGCFRYGWISAAEFETDSALALAAGLLCHWPLWRALHRPEDAIAVVSVARDELLDLGLIRE